MADRQHTEGETVRSVLIEATLAPGPAHEFGTGTPAELVRAYAQDAQPDKIYVHATLIAVLDSGRLVSTERSDMGCSVTRASREDTRTADTTFVPGEGEIDGHIRTMLGLGEHRPPHPAWNRLIQTLANNGIAISEDELMALPLTIQLTPTLHTELSKQT